MINNVMYRLSCKYMIPKNISLNGETVLVSHHVLVYNTVSVILQNGMLKILYSVNKTNVIN